MANRKYNPRYPRCKRRRTDRWLLLLVLLSSLGAGLAACAFRPPHLTAPKAVRVTVHHFPKVTHL
jgi:hypothetical protein